MRHTSCGCCPPDCAEGAELLSGCTGSAVFYSESVTVPSATISFPSCGKRYGRKGRWTRNSADARKNDSFRCAYFRYTFRSPNALRATEESGFRIARYNVRVAPFAPVEYLTYEIRNIYNLLQRRGGRPGAVCVLRAQKSVTPFGVTNVPRAAARGLLFIPASEC